MSLLAHGTFSRYRKGCACQPCRTAASARTHAARTRARVRFAAGEISIRHGRLNSYTYYACRCEHCRTAIRDYARVYHGRRGTP